jgi:hypothetical protein
VAHRGSSVCVRIYRRSTLADSDNLQYSRQNPREHSQINIRKSSSFCGFIAQQWQYYEDTGWKDACPRRHISGNGTDFNYIFVFRSLIRLLKKYGVNTIARPWTLEIVYILKVSWKVEFTYTCIYMEGWVSMKGMDAKGDCHITEFKILWYICQEVWGNPWQISIRIVFHRAKNRTRDLTDRKHRIDNRQMGY